GLGQRAGGARPAGSARAPRLGVEHVMQVRPERAVERELVLRGDELLVRRARIRATDQERERRGAREQVNRDSHLRPPQPAALPRITSLRRRLDKVLPLYESPPSGFRIPRRRATNGPDSP